jgi:membrane protein implicated in regulation of membrane protease activity
MSPDGIALIYGACLLMGFIYSAMQFVFGAHHGAGAGGHGVDVGHHPLGPIHHAAGGHIGHIGHAGHGGHGGHGQNALEDGMAPQTVSFLNPLTIGTWITTFGGFGLISLALLHSVPLSLAASSVTSFLATLLAFYLFLHLLIQPEVVRNMIPAETVGMSADVTVSIPEGPGRMGKVSYILDAKRFSMNAYSQDSRPIPKGAAVRIASVNGQTATVRLLDESAPDLASLPEEKLVDSAA